MRAFILPIFIFYLGIGISATAASDSKRGLTLGLGTVSSEIVGDNDPFFPAVTTDNKQYMLIPNIRYDWDDWSLGANGVGWSHDNETGLSPSITVGYPFSRASLSGQKGWFRYGIEGGLNYSDGLGGEFGLTAGPLKYKVSTGFNKRSDELGQEISLGLPIYINRDIGLTVIGSGFLKFENAAFIEDDLSLTESLIDENYTHSGVSAFAIYRFNERATILLSVKMQLNDEQLTDQITDLNDPQFDVFTMFSYFFGKFPTEAKLASNAN